MKERWKQRRREKRTWKHDEQQREVLRILEHEGLNRLQHFIIKTQTCSYSKKKKKKKEKTEPCRFVSKGEKPVVRSNRPLIFLSCTKGATLLGGYESEYALLPFTVYLMLFSNVYISLSRASHKNTYTAQDPIIFCTDIQSP